MFTYTSTPHPPFSPSLISHMVFVDVKHHVYYVSSEKWLRWAVRVFLITIVFLAFLQLSSPTQMPAKKQKSSEAGCLSDLCAPRHGPLLCQKNRYEKYYLSRTWWVSKLVFYAQSTSAVMSRRRAWWNKPWKLLVQKQAYVGQVREIPSRFKTERFAEVWNLYWTSDRQSEITCWLAQITGLSRITKNAMTCFSTMAYITVHSSTSEYNERALG